MKNVVAACAAVLVLAGGARADEKELAKLKGTWVIVKAEQNGQPFDRAKGDKLIFDGDKVVAVEGKNKRTGKAKIDAGKSPKQMDLIPDEKENPTLQSIYKLEGDELTIRFGREGRPTDFDSAEEMSNMLLVLKREKGEKPEDGDK